MIDRRNFLRLTGASTAGLALSGTLSACGSNTSTPSDAQLLVDESRGALQTLLASPELTQLPRYIRGAKAVLIAPELLRGGFIFGGRGGNAVMLVRLPDGNWSYPAFYGVGGGSFGLQIGGQVSQLVLTIMTDKGLRAVEQSSFTVGADLGFQATTRGGRPVGRGARRQGLVQGRRADRLRRGVHHSAPSGLQTALATQVPIVRPPLRAMQRAGRQAGNRRAPCCPSTRDRRWVAGRPRSRLRRGCSRIAAIHRHSRRQSSRAGPDPPRGARHRIQRSWGCQRGGSAGFGPRPAPHRPSDSADPASG